jgi:tetratricopeptide (TPR) repeat protein
VTHRGTRRSPRRGAVALAGAACVLASVTACERTPPPKATYVGRAACVACHAAEDSLWRGSHHAVAMQAADSASVLGDFNNAAYTYDGLTSRFFRRDSRYWVTTEGPDGALTDYPVSYTFGVYPLQQYLVAFPRGRYQALGIAWDARTKVEGGQRWFHLYPGEKVDHRDVLHWTGMLQNWNFMCAQCHSTNLQKGYVAAADSYATTWSEIDVSCEACHGPASTHVELATRRGKGAGAWHGPSGLTIGLRDTAAAAWIIDGATGLAHRSAPRTNRAEIETCGLCHARRGQVWPDSGAIRLLAQTQRVSLLDEGLYYADGQQQDEVYEYGSFLQSRMYRAGVTCTDCHDPHLSTTRRTGNAVCGACHLATKFDAESHTHHGPGSTGALCANCHMPARNYMVVDARRDHGFKIPRPDLTLAIGTPNACTACHADKTAGWAADAAERWYGPRDSARVAPAMAIAAGRAGTRGAGQSLVALSRDTTVGGITRATAVDLLARNPSPYVVTAIQTALGSPDPLVRRAAAEQLESLDPAMRAPMALPLLDDPVRTVRLAVLPALAGLPDSGWTAGERTAFARVMAEYRASQDFNADRPESWANLGSLDTRLGRIDVAETEYRRAITLQSRFVPAYLQLAELYRTTRQEQQADSVLRMGLDRVPGNTDLQYRLGLALVRQGKKADALPYLKAAAASGSPHYLYVYAVALYDAGQAGPSISTLQGALATSPDDTELLYGLASIAATAGRRDVALSAARRLAALEPGNPDIERFVTQLEGGAPPRQ